MKDDLEHAADIISAAREIEKFLQGVTVDQFVYDDLIQSAVIRKLEIVGEATKRLTPEFRNKHVDVPWKDIVGMRNRLIHAYDDFDLLRVFEAASVRLPKIRTYLERLTSPEKQGDQA